MKVVKNTVITKFEDELQNLKKITTKMPASEKKFVEGVIDSLQQDLAKIQAARTMGDYLDSQAKMNAQTRLIELLNELDHQLQDLKKNGKMRLSSDGVTEVVEQFFLTCQVAEHVIKHSEAEQYISKEQVRDLNQDLKKKVNRLIDLSRTSDLISQALQHSRMAKAVLAPA